MPDEIKIAAIAALAEGLCAFEIGEGQFAKVDHIQRILIHPAH